jgi:hypothetical protein
VQPADQIDWKQLQATFANGSPVLAIGPGCHRIGYEKTAGWQRVLERVRMIWQRLERLSGENEVKARRLFLERFWEAQIHVDDDSPRSRVDDRPRVAETRDEARVALATDLLCGLVEVTRLLGAAIKAGATPVTEWERVSAGEGQEGIRIRARAITWLHRAEELATSLQRIRDAERPDERVLADRGLSASDIDPGTLEPLKVAAIRSGIRDLIALRLDSGSDPVSGAVVEWLSDLLWHVIASGAGVPPSQDELSFYVNLHQIAYSERRFSRPHPGEYRKLKDADAGELRRDLATLLEDYDSGKDGRERDWGQPREAFAQTMACSLVEAWRNEDGKRHSIALISDYDLMFERATLELLGRGEPLHVIAPAVTDAPRPDGKPRFVWLFGTYPRGLNGAGGELPEPEWQRLDRLLPSDMRRPLGPIVIRLTGSPLFALGTIDELGLSEQFDPPATRLEPAAIFSEHDSVQALMALTPSDPPGMPSVRTERRFIDELFGTTGLTWDKRSWLFFGHRFSDWLPRLHLLFTALMLAAERSPGPSWVGEDQPRPIPEACWIAVSRQFDWPEQALLSALAVEMRKQDLTSLNTYFKPPRKHDRFTADFLQSVASTLAPFRNGGPP